MRRQTAAGFTLLEVLVSMTILALVTASIGPAFHSFFEANTNMERRTAAIEAAQRVLDNLRFEDTDDLPASGSGTTESITIANYPFEVTPVFCSDATYCTSVNTRHILVSVAYNGEEIYEIQTVYTKLR